MSCWSARTWSRSMRAPPPTTRDSWTASACAGCAPAAGSSTPPATRSWTKRRWMTRCAPGHLAGAALDVASPSPERHAGIRLLAHPNVVLLPHIGGATAETLANGGHMAAAEIERFASGEPLVNLANRDVAARRRAAVTHVLAIDLGTGSCRAHRVRPRGRPGGRRTARVEPRQHPGRPRLPGLRHPARLAAGVRVHRRCARPRPA